LLTAKFQLLALRWKRKRKKRKRKMALVLLKTPKRTARHAQLLRSFLF
jgi:hypothetical protein